MGETAIGQIETTANNMLALLEQLKSARNRIQKTMPEFADKVAIIDAQTNQINRALQAIKRALGLD